MKQVTWIMDMGKGAWNSVTILTWLTLCEETYLLWMGRKQGSCMPSVLWKRERERKGGLCSRSSAIIRRTLVIHFILWYLRLHSCISFPDFCAHKQTHRQRFLSLNCGACVIPLPNQTHLPLQTTYDRQPPDQPVWWGLSFWMHILWRNYDVCFSLLPPLSRDWQDRTMFFKWKWWCTVTFHWSWLWTWHQHLSSEIQLKWSFHYH